MLVVLAGLPGVGKSTIAERFARQRGAAWLRVDVIEQALRAATGRDRVGAEGYAVAMALAESNLSLGHCVVADSVNPVRESRAGWRDAAARAGAATIDVEVVCSDAAEHRRRVETRPPPVPGLRLPSWEQVVTRDYAAWDRDRLVIDTATLDVAAAVALLDAAVGSLTAGA